MANPARTSLATTEYAFKGRNVEGKKTRGDILFERNTARKQLHEKKIEVVEMEGEAEAEDAWVLNLLVSALRETADKATMKRKLYEYYAHKGRHIRVFTKHSTGEKTHRGIAVIKGVEVDSHLLPDGAYYKKWSEGDEPAFFLQSVRITPETISIEDDGTLKPIKKYE